MNVYEALLIFKREYYLRDQFSIKIINGRYCFVDTIDNFLGINDYQSLRKSEIECFDTENLYIKCSDSLLR